MFKRVPLASNWSVVASENERPDLNMAWMLAQALCALRSQTLELRFVGDSGIERLSPNPLIAKQELKRLFHQGYVLRQDEDNRFYLSRGLPGGVFPIQALERKLDLKPEGQRSIFITYNWNQQEIAVTLQQAFEAQGYLVVRDVDTLHNGTNIKDFMKVITHPKLDYVLPIISVSYLKSKNCMYEVTQVMKRHHWENSLLPYVVTEDSEANAQIYAGVASYRDHWQAMLLKEKDSEEREILENIIRNITPFTRTIATRINVPESELIGSGYKALFELINAKESEKDTNKFKEIEELLRIASVDEKDEEYEAVKKSFENAIAKLKTMKAVHGIDDMFANVYGLYGEYLLRQDNHEEGNQYLRRAKNFGYTASAALANLNLNTPGSSTTPEPSKNTSSSSSPVPVVAKPASTSASSASSSSGAVLHAHKPMPSNTALFHISPQELAKFLNLVAQGEQRQAEAMIQEHPELLLGRGAINDLAGRCSFQLAASKLDPTIARLGNQGIRSFEDITAFQYALWALDMHMAMMLRAQLDKHYPGEAACQASQCTTGAWVRTQGIHAGPHISRLMEALDVYIKNYGPWSGEQCQTHWCRQVGGAQLLLPMHVLNEYCHPSRPFDPTPSFVLTEELPRSRKSQVWDGKKYVPCEDAISKPADGRLCLASDFGVCGGGRRAMGAGRAECDVYVWADLNSLTSLVTVRSQQREELLAKLSQNAGLEGKPKAASLK